MSNVWDVTGKARYRSGFAGSPTLVSVLAECPDGKVRRIYVTGEPDTWFSLPVRVTYKGKTVRGSIMVIEHDRQEPYIRFSPYRYLRNGHMFDHGVETGA